MQRRLCTGEHTHTHTHSPFHSQRHHPTHPTQTHSPSPSGKVTANRRFPLPSVAWAYFWSYMHARGSMRTRRNRRSRRTHKVHTQTHTHIVFYLILFRAFRNVLLGLECLGSLVSAESREGGRGEGEVLLLLHTATVQRSKQSLGHTIAARSSPDTNHPKTQ